MNKHCFQHNPEIIEDMIMSRSLNRITNVLESGDNQGLQSNNAETNTLYESQQCDDVDEIKHMRHNQLESH